MRLGAKPDLEKTPEQGVRERGIQRRDSQETQRALKQPTHDGLRLHLLQPRACHKLPNPYDCIVSAGNADIIGDERSAVKRPEAIGRSPDESS